MSLLAHVTLSDVGIDPLPPQECHVFFERRPLLKYVHCATLGTKEQ